MIKIDTTKKKTIEIYEDGIYSFDKDYKFTLIKTSNGSISYDAEIKDIDPKDPFYFKLRTAIINHYTKEGI